MTTTTHTPKTSEDSVCNDSTNPFCLISPSMGIFCNKPVVAGIIGTIELILGFILLFFPVFTGLVGIWIGGIAFLVLAVFRFVEAFFSRSWGILWNLLSAVLYILVGIYMIGDPTQALETWTIVLAIYFIIAGISRIVIWGSAVRGSNLSGWVLFNGIIALILGGIIISQWPASSAWLLGTIIAVELIVTGWTMLLLSSGSSNTATKNS